MKKFNNLIFIIIFLIFSCAVYAFNKIVDPYEIKHIDYFYSLFNLDRELIYPYIYLTKDTKYDYVFLSSSQGRNFLDPWKFEIYSGKKIFEINNKEISAQELYELLKYFLELHPETKNVIVSLDYYAYLECYDDYTIPRKAPSEFNNFIRFYFSLNAVKDSFKRILPAKVEEKEPLIYFYNDKRKYIYKNYCEYNNLEALKKINTLIEKKNLNVKYFIPPVHALYSAYMLKENNYNHIENLKKGIAEIVPFYDMTFINEFNKKPIRFYWVDVLHTNREIPFTHIFNFILDEKNIDKEYFQYVTKDNVNIILDEQRKAIEKFIQENSSYVENYINFPVNEIESKENYVYKNDLSQKEKDIIFKFNERYKQ